MSRRDRHRSKRDRHRSRSKRVVTLLVGVTGKEVREMVRVMDLKLLQVLGRREEVMILRMMTRAGEAEVVWGEALERVVVREEAGVVVVVAGKVVVEMILVMILVRVEMVTSCVVDSPEDSAQCTKY